MTEGNKNPLISVVCICWNHENYIAKCLTSIIDQTYQEIEIILIDNNSNDKSVEIANEILAKSNKKFIIIQQKVNCGISINLNEAVKNCNGKYLLAISTDDWLTTESIEKKICFLECNKECGLVYSNAYIYYENQDLIVPFINKNAKKGKVFRELLKNNFIFIIGAVFNLNALKKIGQYNENSPIEDWEIGLRMAKNYDIGFLEDKLAYYRKHNNNISNKLKFMLENEIELLDNYNDYFEAKIGKINAYCRFYKLSILRFFSQFSFYIIIKKKYNNL
jgi:alpha-1,3-rhamnosyltransferase